MSCNKSITQSSKPQTWGNMALTKSTAENKAMRTVVTCPYCKKRMQARHLAYKHVCKKQPTADDLQQVSLQKLDKLLGTAVQRLSPEPSSSSSSSNGINLQQKCWGTKMADCAIQSPKDALRALAACPNCGKVSQLRNLSYKHKCKVPADPDTIRKKHALKLQALQDRAMKRLQKPVPEEEDVCGPCVADPNITGNWNENTWRSPI